MEEFVASRVARIFHSVSHKKKLPMSATDGAGQQQRVQIVFEVQTNAFLLLTLSRRQDATEYILNHFGFLRGAKDEIRKAKFIQKRRLFV